MARKQTWPEEGDLLVCIVKSVSDKGAYLEIDGLDGVEGFVFIGEVAAGWVKSVRSHLREGQRVVARPLGSNRTEEGLTSPSNQSLTKGVGMLSSSGRTSNELGRS